jgi:ERCC4-type nuclease
MTIVKPKTKLIINKVFGYKPVIEENFVIIRDTREQMPYEFRGLEVEDRKLDFGDYSVLGYNQTNPIDCEPFGISIERKGINDFYSSITHGRDRFKRELEGMRDCLDFAGLVIEACEEELMCPELSMSEVHPNSVYGTILSIEVRYGVHVYMGNRQSCELKVLSWLSYYYKLKGNQCGL